MLLLFSWWLMWHTFDYRQKTLFIATKAWSDFSATLPLARSFSWGKNWPPEHPLFPGEPIKYHFLFYLGVGFLEKLGLNLGWALNLPSLLGFWGLLVMIYLLTKLLFKNKSIGFLTVIFLANKVACLLLLLSSNATTPRSPVLLNSFSISDTETPVA